MSGPADEERPAHALPAGAVAPGGAASRLIAALPPGAWISGAAIAREGGVTRAAVWKAIERLRLLGYRIEAEAGRGYRLVEAPDLLLPDEIWRRFQPRLFAGGIVHRHEVDSTNRLAADLAREGAAEGTVVLAEAQSAGRGRLGRSWSSPRSRNLYLSLVLRPPVEPLVVPRITLVAGLALAQAVSATIAAPEPRIKWPNDLLLDGRKAAGILTELDAEAERVRHVVLGIGVNLNAEVDDFPPELRDKATSLFLASGQRIDRAAFTARLLGRLEELYDRFCRDGFGPLRPEYDRWHGLVGQEVVVAGRESLRGRVRGVDDEGALLVEADGRVQRVVAGEVTLEDTYRRSPLA